jgi:hypothetical protein
MVAHHRIRLPGQRVGPTAEGQIDQELTEEVEVAAVHVAAEEDVGVEEVRRAGA